MRNLHTIADTTDPMTPKLQEQLTTLSEEKSTVSGPGQRFQHDRVNAPLSGLNYCHTQHG